MSIYDHHIRYLDGTEADLHDFTDKVILAVNVASKCGLTPQYEGLEQLHEEYSDRGFAVLGFPCNQFKGQEPGTSEEIAAFCSLTYGVTFPMFERVDVNGDERHPIYADLVSIADNKGETGDITWNFEKFLIGPGGEFMTRFRPHIVPDNRHLVAAIESHLPR